MPDVLGDIIRRIDALEAAVFGRKSDRPQAYEASGRAARGKVDALAVVPLQCGQPPVPATANDLVRRREGPFFDITLDLARAIDYAQTAECCEQNATRLRSRSAGRP